jgi:hypothetical protein
MMTKVMIAMVFIGAAPRAIEGRAEESTPIAKGFLRGRRATLLDLKD